MRISDWSSDVCSSDLSDRLAGGHHHGDSGSGLIILASADATVAALLDEAHGLVPDRPALGFRIQGPERPPKPSTISACTAPLSDVGQYRPARDRTRVVSGKRASVCV